MAAACLLMVMYESYLSIKYGLTLNQGTPQNYISSSGTILYDASGALSSYTFNIAGIGRDDSSALNQKQSRSSTTNSIQENNTGLVTIGLETIAVTNELNTNNFLEDQSFILWGNNAESTSFSTSFESSATTFTRMQRLWAIQETNNVGSVQIRIPQSIFNSDLSPSLVISADATIDQADTVIPLIDDGNNNYIATANFNDGDFFTFAQSEVSESSEAVFFVAPLPNSGAVIFGL